MWPRSGKKIRDRLLPPPAHFYCWLWRQEPLQKNRRSLSDGGSWAEWNIMIFIRLMLKLHLSFITLSGLQVHAQPAFSMFIIRWIFSISRLGPGAGSDRWWYLIGARLILAKWPELYGIIALFTLGVTAFSTGLSAEAWYRFIEKNKVTVWYSAPTAIRSWWKLEMK